MTGLGRGVSQIVDGGGLYFSRLASAGGYVFFAGPAVDETGALSEETHVAAPYDQSASAIVRAQTSFVLSRVRDGLISLGSSMRDVCQVEQYITRKSHADGYIETSRGPGFMETNRPGSALVQSGDFLPTSAVVIPTGIAVIPEAGLVKEVSASGLPTPGAHPEMGESYSREAPYSEIVTAGPYVFNTVWASDYETGVHPDARAPQWVWWGNEARNETRFNLLERLKPRLEQVQTGPDNVVHATVYLTEMEDLYEVDRVWREVFPSSPPARTVVPVKGLGSPRAEGAKTQAEGGTKTEAIFQSIRPNFGAVKEVVSTGTQQLLYESEAVKAGPLLWISGQVAGYDHDVLTMDALTQTRRLFDRIEEITSAGGSDLSQLLRIRGYVTDIEVAYILYAVLRERIPSNPPTVAVSIVPGPLHVPGARLTIDAVGYVATSQR